VPESVKFHKDVAVCFWQPLLHLKHCSFCLLHTFHLTLNVYAYYLAKSENLSKRTHPVSFSTISVLLLTKYWLKWRLTKLLRGTLHSYLWLKRCESTGLTVCTEVKGEVSTCPDYIFIFISPKR